MNVYVFGVCRYSGEPAKNVATVTVADPLTRSHAREVVAARFNRMNPAASAPAASALSPSEASLLELPLKERTEAPRKREYRIAWTYAIGIAGIHALALLAFLPYFFTWSAAVFCVAGFYLFGTLGINICYHRLLTHRGFRCPRWLECTLATLGICCLQEPPARWVAIHRMHHQYSDEEPDPHSPIINFLWSHVGWIIFQDPQVHNLGVYERYAPDLLRDRFYLRQERTWYWLIAYAAHALVIYLIGATVGAIVSGTVAEATRYGMSWLVWGVFVRTVAVWHITWSVNSVTHLWGSQRYTTGENSKNNLIVALISNGEGWHNNHHADQRSARHGHRWWEFDVSYLTIRAWQSVGLAWDVVTPRSASLDRST